MEAFDDDSIFHDPGGMRPLTADTVMGVWHEHARTEAPWSAMPLDDRPGTMRPLIDALLDVTGGLECSIRRRDIRMSAAIHGRYRRGQGCSAQVVSDDFGLLRLALKMTLYRMGVPAPASRRFIRCLLPDWRMARRAAEDGHLRCMVELRPYDSQPD